MTGSNDVSVSKMAKPGQKVFEGIFCVYVCVRERDVNIGPRVNERKMFVCEASSLSRKIASNAY